MKPPKPPTLPCSHCKGTGRIELTGEYLETLNRLRELGKEMSGAELAKDMGIQPTAMNNRLSRIEQHGLIQSRRWGRSRLFRVADKTAGRE
jgi:Mn-dependent DtxR family transcriptional regulator